VGLRACGLRLERRGLVVLPEVHFVRTIIEMKPEGILIFRKFLNFYLRVYVFTFSLFFFVLKKMQID